MDIRIEKTKTAIRNAFLSLRKTKPTEKISVRELCALARVNKSTFYSHYRDIYDLAEAIETELIREMLGTIPPDVDYSVDHPEVFTREILNACIDYLSASGNILTETDIHHLGKRIETGVRELIYAKYPAYRNDPRMNVLLTFCIMGTHYAYWHHNDMDRDELIRHICSMVVQIHPLL